MEHVTITGPENLYLGDSDQIDWRVAPDFQFETEVDALRVLQLLNEDLESAREQARHVLRYMEAAAKAARAGTARDGKVSMQAIIRESGVARATVYKWIEEKASGFSPAIYADDDVCVKCGLPSSGAELCAHCEGK